MNTVAPAQETIVYRLTWRDLRAAEKQMCAKSFVARIYYLALRALFPAIAVSVVIWISITEGFDAIRKGGWWSVYPFLICLVAQLCIYLLHRRSIKRSGIFESDISTALRDEGLWQKDQKGESLTFWGSIKSIWATTDHFFFRSSGIEGELFHYVPRRAFPTRESADAFYREALQLWTAHRPALPGQETIIYRMTWRDMKAVEKQLAAESFRARLDYWSQMIARPAIIVGLPIWVYLNHWRTWPFLLILGLIPLFSHIYRRSVEKSGIFDSDIAVALRAEGFWQKDGKGESVEFWSSVKSISETADHFFFKCGTQGRPFRIVPKRAFPTREAADAFYGQALRLWNADRSVPATKQ